MKGTKKQLLFALKPLGDSKTHANQVKYNCPNCEKQGHPINKYNLEVNYDKGQWHCWCCNNSGSLYTVIQKYGYKEYLELFKTQKDEFESLDKKNESTEIFELPKYLISALNHPPAVSYLESRGISKEQIKKYNILYCYSGDLQDYLLFPGYNKEDKLTGYATHSLKTKRYKNFKSKDFICLWENLIDKTLPIIITEGQYDALSLPNSIPLLGMTLSNQLVDWLTECSIIIILDTSVSESVYKNMKKQLNKVTEDVRFCYIPKRYDDPNDIAVIAKEELIDLLKTYY